MSTSPGGDFALNVRRWLVILWIGLGASVVQLVALHVFRHDELLKKSRKFIVRKWEVEAERGSLLDRNGIALAHTTASGSVFADPLLVRDKPATARGLAPILGMTAAHIEKLLGKKGRFVWLSRRLDEPALSEARSLKLSGIGIKPELKRSYPYGTLAAHTVGFVNCEHQGGAGLECSMEGWLAGKDGCVLAEVDGGRRVIPGRRVVERPPQRGRDVILTLDVKLQEAAEAALAATVVKWKAAGGTVIVMDPRDGAILALACLPSFDPEHYLEYPKQRWTHPAVSYVYEPGSTFKLVTACAALEEKAVAPGEKVVYCTGSAQIGNRIIHCAVHGKGGHGSLDLPGVVIHSCNIGASRLEARVGAQKMARWIRLLGFARKTNVGLGGEAAGWFPDPAKWTPIVGANIAFGQSVTVTPLQLLAAYCAPANGGILPHPHLVKGIAASARQKGRTFEYPGRRVMSEGTADTLRGILRRVVTEGTGKAVALAAYEVAGKTGTAQKPTREAGFKSGKYVSSFVGFLPAGKPSVAIIAIVDEPQGGHYGAVVAAPLFRTVAGFAATYLNVPPSPGSGAQAARKGPAGGA
jgi:stage V sporulation protein D (sporulation-specific penicillin-binding protein)